MKNTITIYRKIACLITNEGFLQTNGIRPIVKDLGLIYNGALVYSSQNGVLWAGKDSALPREYRKKKFIDCKMLTAYPGLIDSHTHPIFGGNRAKEFSMRMQGATYQEIAAAGGGILSTVHATRKLSAPSMEKIFLQRLENAYRFGVRVLEAKSGYGLNLASEIRSLSAIRSGEKKFKKILALPTCMAAHAVPPEFKGKQSAWVEEICTKILPVVAKKKLARFVDVFCDKGYFTIEDTKIIAATAKKLNLGLRLHGDELANLEVAALAAELGAYSVDHLLKISDAGILALASSSTIATLLPGTSLFLREPPAPARKLIDAGVAVALATDFNPGTCPTQNLPFIASLAAIQLGMTSAEIIAGITWNAARALGISSHYGALVRGYFGEPVFVEGDDPAAIYYWLARENAQLRPSQ